MAIFLDKKERVIDFQLTPYGKYLLSIGIFKPIYYSFFDSGVLYDGSYAGLKENQKDIHDRIKKNTQYLESLVCFRELESSPPFSSEYHEHHGKQFTFDLAGESAKQMMTAKSWDPSLGSYGTLDSYNQALGITGDASLYKYLHQEPRADAFKFESAIGDARFDGDKQQNAPAWKIVTLQGMISSSAQEAIDFLYKKSWGRNEQKIPQINITANYFLQVAAQKTNMDPTSVDETQSQTRQFSDGRVIELVHDDILVYASEINTEILNENFDIEVYKTEKVQGKFGNGIVEIKTDPSQGDTITIKDGTGASNTYEFRSNYASITAGNVWVPYFPGSDKWDAMASFKMCFSSFMCVPGGILPSWADVTILAGDDGAQTWAKIQYNKYLDLYITPHVFMDSSTGLPKNRIEIRSQIDGLNADKGSFSTTAPDSRINVSGVTGSTNTLETLIRKNFNTPSPQIVDGYMVSPQQTQTPTINLGTSSVEYYFDVHTDFDVNQKLACRGAQLYDNNSYYIDLDFECEKEENICTEDDKAFYDIYGKVVEDPEICQT